MMELLLPFPPHTPQGQSRISSSGFFVNSMTSSAPFEQASSLDGTVERLVGINEGSSSPGMGLPNPPDNITQLPEVKVNEETHIAMVDKSREVTTAHGRPNTEPNSRPWNVDCPEPNARTSQFLPFQRLSLILSSSLSGGARTTGDSCSIGPNSPPQYPHATIASRNYSNGQCEIGIPATGISPQDGSPVSLEKNTIPPCSSVHSSGTLDPGPPVEVIRNSKPLQRPKNPMNKILEEEHQKLKGTQSHGQTQESQPEPKFSDHTSILHSQSHILTSLFATSSPRLKPTATDTLLYWLLQDHTAGEDIPTFSRMGEQKSFFRLIMCLWAEPIIGSGPFNKEWKRLLRKREMKRWSEVGGEAEVNVVSILVMMSLFGAELGLGICRGGSKIQHKRLTSPPHTMEVTKSPQDSQRTAVAITPRSVPEDVPDLPKQEQALIFCPVCKRRRKGFAACPCARALLQGMGVIDPVAVPQDTIRVPAPSGSQRGRSMGRRSSRKGAQHNDISLDSKTQSLPPILGTPAAASVDLVEPAASPVSRRKSQRTSNPLESAKCIFPKIQEWLEDETASNAIDPKAHQSTNITSTLALATDSDNTTSPGIIINSRNEDSSAQEPFILNTIPSMTSSTYSSDLPEVNLNREADVNSTLFGAATKLYAETLSQSSPHDTHDCQTPPLLAVPLGCQLGYTADQPTPLTNIEINVQFEDDRMPRSRGLSSRGMPKTLACGATVAELDHKRLQDEDFPPEWVEIQGHLGR